MRSQRRATRGRVSSTGRALALSAVAAGVLGGAVLAVADPFPAGDNAWPYASTARSPVLAAVGDISCQPSAPVEGEKQKDVCDKTGSGYTTRWQAQTATANQIEGMQPNLVAIMGDEQYEVGRYQDFMGSGEEHSAVRARGGHDPVRPGIRAPGDRP